MVLLYNHVSRNPKSMLLNWKSREHKGDSLSSWKAQRRSPLTTRRWGCTVTVQASLSLHRGLPARGQWQKRLTPRAYPSQSQELCRGSPAAEGLLLLCLYLSTKQGLFTVALSSPPHHHPLFSFLSPFFAVASSCSSFVLCPSSYLHSSYVLTSFALGLPS